MRDKLIGFLLASMLLSSCRLQLPMETESHTYAEEMYRERASAFTLSFLKIADPFLIIDENISISEIIDKGRNSKRLKPKLGEKRNFTIKETSIAGVNTILFVPKKLKNNKSLIYFHGGAFLKGPLFTHYNLAATLAQSLGRKVYVPLYTLSHEKAYPQALNEAQNIYIELLKTHAAKDLSLLGDSAGGGLILALDQKLRDDKIEQPGKIVAISPWVELTMENPDMEPLAKKPVALSAIYLRKMADLYAGTENLKSPYISPLYGDFKNLSPTFLLTSDRDLLYPDCLRYIEKAKKTIGYDFISITAPNQMHVWVAALGLFSEAKIAAKQIADYLEYY